MSSPRTYFYTTCHSGLACAAAAVLNRNVTTLLLQKVHLWLCGKTPARTNLDAKICPLNSVVRPIYGCLDADPDSLPCKKRWRSSSSDATRDRSWFSNEALRWRSQEHNLGSVQHPLRGAMTSTSTIQSQQTLFCCNHMSLPDLLLATQGTMSTGTCSTHVALCTCMNYDSRVFDTQYSDIFLNYDLDTNAIRVQLDLFILF